MDTAGLRILLIEDDAVDREAVSRHLEHEHTLFHAATGAEARAHVDYGDPVDCVLLDYHLPDVEGLELLSYFVGRTIPVVMFTGSGSEDVAVEAMKRGAQDYLVKDKVTQGALHRAIRAAIEMVKLKQELADKQEQLVARTAEAEARTLQLRRYAKALTQTEQRERRRLSNLVHNHLQQLMTAAVMRLEGLRKWVSEEPAGLDVLQQSQDLLRQCIREARSLNVEISPPVLHHSGLAEALHWLAAWMADKHGLNVAVYAGENAEPSSEELKVFLFEATRELLFNSVKHGKVSHAAIHLDRGAGDLLQLRVIDKGEGCNLLHAGRTSDGIGIFSISERIEMFGGSVAFTTAPGEGFRTEILAPISADETSPEFTGADGGSNAGVPDASPGPPKAQSIRILLADDHKLVREGLVNILHEHGDFEVVAEAEDGRSALRLALETRPDVVVTDVNMPDMNGIEATRLIRESLPDIAIIGLSVNDDENTMRAMREAGAVAYVNKEAASDELCETIRAVCTAKTAG